MLSAAIPLVECPTLQQEWELVERKGGLAHDFQIQLAERAFNNAIAREHGLLIAAYFPL